MLIVERWLLGRLRRRTFYSLADLNAAIVDMLRRLTDERPIRRLGVTRRQLLEDVDRPALNSLPAEPYEFAQWKTCRVGVDYHVEIASHYYSVPYRFARAEVEARLTVRTVEIFHRGERIAAHLRMSGNHGHTTVADHMPSSHRRYKNWTIDKIRADAGRIGPATAALCEQIIEHRPHPEQGFRACLGIVRLAKSYGEARVEAAAERAIAIGAHLCLGQIHPRQETRSPARRTARRGGAGDPARQHPRPALLQLGEKPLLKHPTLDQLHALGLHGMAKAFVEVSASDEAGGLSHPEWLGLLLDRETSLRQDKRMAARLRAAKLRQQACVEDIDYRSPRGLDRAMMQKLVDGDWIDAHDNLVLVGPTGVGKSWLASALGHKACRDNQSVLYQRVPRLFEELALARGDLRHARLLRAFGRADLLVLDDWGLEPLDAAARHDLLEILEERYGRKSTLVTSQLPVDRWHEIIRDPTYADAIMDRLVHNAHRIELTGESMRRRRAKSGVAS